MNAVAYKKYGGPEVLHTAEIEMPEPEKHQVRVKVYAAGVNFGDLETIKDLIDADVLKRVVDRSFPMEEASGAHRYVEQGERKGPVVIVMKKEGGSDGK